MKLDVLVNIKKDKKSEMLDFLFSEQFRFGLRIYRACFQTCEKRQSFIVFYMHDKFREEFYIESNLNSTDQNFMDLNLQAKN